MKSMNLTLLAFLLPLSSCSSPTSDASLLEQKQNTIEALREQLEAQDLALQEKTDTINEQHELIENQHARLQDLTNVLYDRENNYIYQTRWVNRKKSSENENTSIEPFQENNEDSYFLEENLYPGLGPYTAEPDSETYAYSSATNVESTYRYSSQAGNSQTYVEQEESLSTDPLSKNYQGGKTVSMKPISPQPQISDLRGQQRGWAQKIYQAILDGHNSIEVDPNYFGYSKGTMDSPVAAEIEKAVYFTLYPQASYFNSGMLFSKGHLVVDEEGNATSFSLFLKDYMSSYPQIIEDWIETMLSGIDSGTTEFEAYEMIHDRVCQYLSYTPEALHNSLAVVIATGQGVCNDYAEMVVSLCRAAGIEARYIIGYADGNYHAWVQVKLNGDWYYSDPTNDDQNYGIIRNYYLSETLFNGYEISQIDI